MNVSPKLYLPMSNRAQGYCVTLTEQIDLSRRFGVDEGFVLAFLHQLQKDMASGAIEPQKTATKTKRIIDAELNAAMQTGVRAR